MVNASLSLAPLGSLNLINSGFTINSRGLVARVEISAHDLGTAFDGAGLGFSATLVLALNTTGSDAFIGNATVVPGLLLHLDGSISLLGATARAPWTSPSTRRGCSCCSRSASTSGR